MSSTTAPPAWPRQLSGLWRSLRAWPWLDTLRTLRQRFREDRLGLTASSLTFTTLIGLVPLVTVMLAVFSAFPMFSRFQKALEQYLLQSLVPDSIAKPVLGALTQFAAKASQVGTLGLVALVVAALAMVFTIDRALNAIWRVRRPRPLAQRVLVYWAALTLGPLLLGISLSLTSYAISASRGLVDTLPGGLSLLLGAIEFMLLAGGMTGLYRYVPNTYVSWSHAWAGGLFVAAGVEVAKRLLAWYVGLVPTYSMIYGAFATLPIFLLWIYLAWVVVLLGAVIAAYAPSLSMHVARMPDTPGYRFALAVALLRELARVRGGPSKGLAATELAGAVHVDPLQVEPVLDSLVGLDWVGRLDEEGARRYVLLADPQATLAAPMVDSLLLEPTPTTQSFRARAAFGSMRLHELF
ncbi:MAG: YihY family inner membrane protein [Burkholderiaceae bacterium]